MKFFENIRANIPPPMKLEISNGIFSRFFSPFSDKNNFDFFYYISSGMRLKTKRNWGNHKNNWELLNEALEKNSPKLGIIASWGIFEKEAKLKFGKWRTSYGLIKETTELLNLEKYKQKNLLLIKNKRNKLAHLGSINSTWSEVDQILDVALKLHMK
tara:strand:+ start:15 stop:485 length:471 start_codon:yes stop_codon:yes gene_type:complete